MNEIIKVTKKLNLSVKQKKIFKALSSDLDQILQKITEIDQIVVRGGFIPDTLLDCKPKDIDLFYSVNSHSQKCYCGQIKIQINKLNLTVIGKKYDYDLENSYEKDPRLSPIERTVDFFSYHTDWFSMFCLDSNGDIWTNKKTFKYFKQGISEIRYQGSLPWAYFPREGDSKDYFVSLACEIIRGVSHTHRRNLKIGPDFAELLKNAPFILEKAVEVPQGQRVIKYLAQKFNDIQSLEKAIISLELKNSKKMINGFRHIYNKYGNRLTSF